MSRDTYVRGIHVPLKLNSDACNGTTLTARGLSFLTYFWFLGADG